MSSVARRYAKALFSLAQEANSVEATASELGRLAALANAPELRDILSSPLLSVSSRTQLVQAIAQDLKLSDLLTRFARLLADHQRLAELPFIQHHFDRLLDASLGRVRATIRSASRLDPHQQNALVATFSKLTGKQVVPNLIVDAELLGGVVIEVGGRVYDGSVRTQLERLAKQLAGTASI